VEAFTASGGPALGVFEEAGYREGSLRLAPGESLLIYTDGATDARSPSGEQFGLARVESTLRASAKKGANAEGLVGDLFGSLQQYETGAAQEDDITLLALRYLGVGGMGGM
jgi:sigma-B regulation protein RsbU (phosphoserine phosphatase)